MKITPGTSNTKRRAHRSRLIAHSLLTLMFFSIILHSCKCSDTKNCGIISDEAEKWIHFFPHDSVKFVNDAGQHIKFTVSTLTKSPFYDEKACFKSELGGCHCDYKCQANGVAEFSGDSSAMRIEIQEGYDNSVKNKLVLNYALFDFHWSMDLLGPIVATPYDSLRSAIQLGNLIYQDVYVNAIDTTISSNQNAKIWKVYYSKPYGVLGFWDRQSQTLYYRE